MDDFKGSKCIICDNLFDENDDIVVCPVCGTPYHRACYKSAGKCVNFSLHESGGSWQPAVVPDTANPSDTLCQRCGKQNPETSLFCEACGFPLKSFIKTERPLRTERDYADSTEQDNLFIHPQLVNYSDPLCGFNPDEDFEGVKLSEIADYVDKNTHYYLPIFKGFKTFGRYFSWNFIAFIFPELFFAHRKMIFPAIAAFITRLIIMIPNFIRFFSSVNAGEVSDLAKMVDINSGAFSTFAIIFVVADYLRMWLFSTNANRLYYKKAIRDIKKLKASEPATDGFYNNTLAVRLHRKGGTSALWLSLFTCLLLLPLASMYLYAMFSGFLIPSA
jgi:ribosomal protein L37E